MAVLHSTAVCAAAPVVRPAKSGRDSSAAARMGRSRRTAEPAHAATPRCAKAGSKLSRVSGPERRPAEQDSGGEASGRGRSHDADADWATRRPGDPATRRPGDPATRRPGDPATRRPGDPATRRPGDPATRRPGDPATRRPGDPATRRPGDPATRRPGDHYTVGTLSGTCQPPGRTNCARLAVQTQRLQDTRSRRAQHVPRLVRHGHRVASEPVARLTVPRPVRRRTQSRQASPVPLAQTVNRTRRQIKTMNADRERTPRDAHLDHHRRSPLSRHRVGRAREGRGVTTRIHIKRPEPRNDVGLRLSLEGIGRAAIERHRLRGIIVAMLRSTAFATAAVRCVGCAGDTDARGHDGACGLTHGERRIVVRPTT